MSVIYWITPKLAISKSLNQAKFIRSVWLQVCSRKIVGTRGHCLLENCGDIFNWDVSVDSCSIERPSRLTQCQKVMWIPSSHTQNTTAHQIHSAFLEELCLLLMARRRTEKISSFFVAEKLLLLLREVPDAVTSFYGNKVFIFRTAVWFIAKWLVFLRVKWFWTWTKLKCTTRYVTGSSARSIRMDGRTSRPKVTENSKMRCRATFWDVIVVVLCWRRSILCQIFRQILKIRFQIVVFKWKS